MVASSVDQVSPHPAITIGQLEMCKHYTMNTIQWDIVFIICLFVKNKQANQKHII